MSDDPIQSWQKSSKAQFDKVKEAQKHLQALRQGLDRLLELGDFVEPDDVVKVAAELVGKGFTPQELATVLSDMPMQGGEILQQWLLMHDQQVKEMELQVEPVLANVRHQLATSSLHALLQDHMQRQQMTAPTAGSA